MPDMTLAAKIDYVVTGLKTRPSGILAQQQHCIDAMAPGFKRDILQGVQNLTLAKLDMLPAKGVAELSPDASDDEIEEFFSRELHQIFVSIYETHRGN
jgi:hypothetical protein